MTICRAIQDQSNREVALRVRIAAAQFRERTKRAPSIAAIQIALGYKWKTQAQRAVQHAMRLGYIARDARGSLQVVGDAHV